MPFGPFRSRKKHDAAGAAGPSTGATDAGRTDRAFQNASPADQRLVIANTVLAGSAFTFLDEGDFRSFFRGNENFESGGSDEDGVEQYHDLKSGLRVVVGPGRLQVEVIHPDPVGAVPSYHGAVLASLSPLGTPASEISDGPAKDSVVVLLRGERFEFPFECVVGPLTTNFRDAEGRPMPGLICVVKAHR